MDNTFSSIQLPLENDDPPVRPLPLFFSPHQQRRVFFLAIKTPAMIGIPYIAPFIQTPDGVNLSCYLLPQTPEFLAKPYRKKSVGGGGRGRRKRAIHDVKVDLTPAASRARATVIVFHGNAAHHWEDMESAGDFFGMGCNVLLASYRGYADSLLCV